MSESGSKDLTFTPGTPLVMGDVFLGPDGEAHDLDGVSVVITADDGTVHRVDLVRGPDGSWYPPAETL